MNWEAIGATGELIGAIAVVVSHSAGAVRSAAANDAIETLDMYKK